MSQMNILEEHLRRMSQMDILEEFTVIMDL